MHSGVLTSVHSFAADPARRVYIGFDGGGGYRRIGFICPPGAFVILRGRRRFCAGIAPTGILLNNIFLSAAAFAVLLGTMYPLILDALNAGKISVGPPYFNAVFAPLASAAAALSVFGAVSYWKSDSFARLLKKLSPVLFVAIIVGALLPLFAEGDYNYAAAAGLILACWILFGTMRAATLAHNKGGGGFWGMIIAHFGIGIFVAGITLVGAYQSERDVKMIIGEGVELGGMVFTLQKVSTGQGENYRAIIADIAVAKNGKTIAGLQPEKRFYKASPKTAMTEAGISAELSGDLYASLGAQLADDAWSARLQIKPFIRFIWGGALLMALGALIAAITRRRHSRPPTRRMTGIKKIRQKTLTLAVSPHCGIVILAC